MGRIVEFKLDLRHSRPGIFQRTGTLRLARAALGNGDTTSSLYQAMPVIILDRTSHPGNIGATARVMANMGLTELRLVAPDRFPHPEAVQLAANGAEVLARAQVYATMEEAVGDRNFLVATTNRGRGQRQTVLTPRQLGEQWADISRSGTIKGGIMFGTERTGLLTKDVERADCVCNIPTVGGYGSLNLSHAVMVIAYEIMASTRGGSPPGLIPVVHRTLATNAEMDRLFQHLEEVLRAIDFIKPGRGHHMMGSLKAIFNRAALDSREVSILRGILHETLASRERH
ncbi:MAG: RNA methyltransferase [Magnetococcales bacterium]|nr:RNA methyltransferase [Magnetococcales bacterium]